jgi:hypothetical protein
MWQGARPASPEALQCGCIITTSAPITSHTMQISSTPMRHDMEKPHLCIGVTMSASLWAAPASIWTLYRVALCTISARSCENYRSAMSLLAPFHGATAAIKNACGGPMACC